MEISVEQMAAMLKSGVTGVYDRGTDGILIETNTGFVFLPCSEGDLEGAIQPSVKVDSNADTRKITNPVPAPDSLESSDPSNQQILNSIPTGGCPDTPGDPPDDTPFSC